MTDQPKFGIYILCRTCRRNWVHMTGSEWRLFCSTTCALNKVEEGIGAMVSETLEREMQKLEAMYLGDEEATKRRAVNLKEAKRLGQIDRARKPKVEMAPNEEERRQANIAKYQAALEARKAAGKE